MKKRATDIGDKTRRVIILSAILVIILITAYFNFLNYRKCKDITCFNNNLAKCKRAVFSSIKEDSAWFYAIKGTSQGKCVVFVRNIDIESKEANEIIGKEMLCYLPSGVVMSPESDITVCHGLLKESLQDVIIKQLHVLLVENIGQIKESITTPV